MQKGRDILIACRSEHAELRRLREDYALLDKSLPMDSVGGVLKARRDACRAAIDGSRKRRDILIAQALQVLDRLPRRERKVLYLYYVLGYTARRIADEEEMDERTVYKQKASGLELLEDGRGITRTEKN